MIQYSTAMCQVERALEEPPRLASCAYQGAWNTTGTVTYSTALLDHRWTYQPMHHHYLVCPSSLFSFSRAGDEDGWGGISLGQFVLVLTLM